MKKILSALLVAAMLLTVAVSMASCAPIDFVKGFFVSMEKIEEKCEELLEVLRRVPEDKRELVKQMALAFAEDQERR